MLNHVNEIPDLNINELDAKSDILHLVFNWFGGGIGIYSRERIKSDKALKIVRDIKGKYASAEFMLKNYFS
ncbi:hypothetical protein [Winogradskyella haliclonae]|uniref:Uncharacterized protein n=1 Tax=Winogradskyella haliclonae TaxID=2048558 RepID=A0ABQ2BXB9_9FLAO|nr:hypothetical protein [Winogradskyella haliclonae]GGI57137.1 hypothetical protein GCM10011444_14460 [Winogradskyella haliclonae]